MVRRTAIVRMQGVICFIGMRNSQVSPTTGQSTKRFERRQEIMVMAVVARSLEIRLLGARLQWASGYCETIMPSCMDTIRSAWADSLSL